MHLDSGLCLHDEPDVIMNQFSIDKFNKIIKSLRDNNLFLIKIINEEEE